MSIEQVSGVNGWRATRPDDADLAVDGLAPRFVCAPIDVDEVSRVVGEANESNRVVIPRGGGTRMGLGFPPAAADVLLQTTNLNRVVDYEPADLTLTIEAGATLGKVQDLLRPEGQFLALDPPLASKSTLGGIIASNASGPLRLAYGSARDLVIGTRVVNADGIATKAGGRVVKNVAGYDLNKLYVGSLGTVGIVVELSFKLWPLPHAEATLLASFLPAQLESALSELLRTPLSPLSLEAFNPSAARWSLDADAGEGRWLLATRLGGSEKALERQLRDVERIFADAGAADLERRVDDHSRLWGRIADHASAADDEVLVRLAVPISRAVAAMNRLDELARVAGVRASIQARAGSGVVYGRLGLAEGWSAESLTAAKALVEQGRAWAVAQGGSLVLEAAPVALKSMVDVWGDVGPALKVMRALKEQLDPRGTLNRGRFVARM